jgi:hypothetical protein
MGKLCCALYYEQFGYGKYMPDWYTGYWRTDEATLDTVRRNWREHYKPRYFEDTHHLIRLEWLER